MKEPIELLEERIKEMTETRDMIKTVRDTQIMKRQYNALTNMINQYKVTIRLIKFWTSEDDSYIPLDKYWLKRYKPELAKRVKKAKRISTQHLKK